MFLLVSRCWSVLLSFTVRKVVYFILDVYKTVLIAILSMVAARQRERLFVYYM